MSPVSVLRWQVSDPDGDEIVKSVVYIREIGSEVWDATALVVGDTEIGMENLSIKENKGYEWKVVVWDEKGASGSSEIWGFTTYDKSSWERTYGGSGSEIAYSIVQDENGNYVVVGSKDGYWWILKLNEYGNVIWQLLEKRCSKCSRTRTRWIYCRR